MRTSNMKSIIRKAGRRLPTSFVLMPVLACALTVAITVNSNAQERQKISPPPVQSSNDSNLTSVVIEPNEDYRIGSGDVIDIRVDRAPELSGTFRVTAGGTFAMPFLNRIKAQNKTPEELAVTIADGLRGRYLKEPSVAVTVRQINSHSFFIQGAVQRPGVYQIEGRPSLLKLITVAGGLADNHGSTAFVIRESKMQSERIAPPVTHREGSSVTKTDASVQNADDSLPVEEDAKYEMFKMNITGLLKGRFDQNVSLQPGDIINIPQSDVFFVTGEVKEPGSFGLKDGTTLRQAISLAQGTTFKAAAGRAIIFREDPVTGRRDEIKVNIDEVMSGKKEDVPIMANDIIIVPNSRFKSVSSALLNAFGVSSTRLLPF